MSNEALNVDYAALRRLIAEGEARGNPFTHIAGETRDLMRERDALAAERDRLRTALAHYATEALRIGLDDFDSQNVDGHTDECRREFLPHGRCRCFIGRATEALAAIKKEVPDA